MNFYETMYIIHPALQAGRLEDIIANIDKKIDSLKGEKLYFDNWGKKKLAYAIDKQKYGTYVLVQFSMESKGIQDLSSEFEHNSNILRYLINRIEQEQILTQKETKEFQTDKKDDTTKDDVIEKNKEKDTSSNNDNVNKEESETTGE